MTKTLLPRLENAKLKVCIDFCDFEPGKAALHNMRDASKRCQRTLLAMTPNWVSSEWTVYENILARTNDPAGLKKRTIPLLLEKCEIPEVISILTYVDFTRPDREDFAWRQLFTALGKPPEPPKVPQHDDWFLAHPSADAPKGCTLVRFAATSPAPGEVSRLSILLGLDISIAKGEKPQLHATFAGRKVSFQSPAEPALVVRPAQVSARRRDQNCASIAAVCRVADAVG